MFKNPAQATRALFLQKHDTMSVLLGIVCLGSHSLYDYPVPNMAYFSVLEAYCPQWVASQRSVTAFYFFLPSYFPNTLYVTFKKLQKIKQCFSATLCSLYKLGNSFVTYLSSLRTQGSVAAVMSSQNIFPTMPHSHCKVLKSYGKEREEKLVILSLNN